VQNKELFFVLLSVRSLLYAYRPDSQT